MSYIKTKSIIRISEILNKSGTENTLAASDFRELNVKNKNLKSLKKLMKKATKGQEIGSKSYMKKSNYRFLKTNNVSNNFILDESSIEYSIPVEGTHPKKNDILVVKDGGCNGLGEVCLYPHDNKNKKDSVSSGIIVLSLKEDLMHYVFGILKSKLFKNYLDLNTPQGSTIRHSKMIALDFKVPFPTTKNNPDPNSVEKIVSLIVQNIIDKEKNIRAKNELIDELIQKNLHRNKNFKNREKTTILKLKENNFKMDSGIYGDLVKEIDSLIKSNKNGYFILSDYYYYSRGQNLQVSQIGESVYSKINKKSFYKLVTNVEMQDDRTISGFRYLGNPNKLRTLPKRSILFAADGAIVGRSFFYDDLGYTITNLHPWVITNKNKKDEIYKTVYVSSFLSYLKNIGYLDKIKDKSNGGGLKGEHLEKWIKIPIFKKEVQKEIAYNIYSPLEMNKGLTLDNYIEKEFERNKNIGIFQLNMELFKLKEKLNKIIDQIISNEHIEIDLDC